jgi:hypothetical protein
MSTNSCGTRESASVSRTARSSTVSSTSPTAPIEPTPSNTFPAQCNWPSPVQARKGPEAKSSSTSTTGAATGEVAEEAACGDSRGVPLPSDISFPLRISFAEQRQA